MAKRIDPATLEAITGTLYPSPFDEPCRPRQRKRLGDVAGLTQFGVNLLRLPPGAWSSQRHWHTGEDEFVYVLTGEVVLVTNAGEEVLRAGDAAGLTQFGVNLLRLPPGTWSSQRHWHTGEDEFVYVLAGEIVLVTDDGEETLRAGDAAGFPANEGNGHCLQNRSDHDATVIEVGARTTGSVCYYPGIDMVAPAGGKPAAYTHRDGTPYENIRRRGP